MLPLSLLLSLALSLPEPACAQGSQDSFAEEMAGLEPYDLSSTPLDERDARLLKESGYRLEDRYIFASSQTSPVGREDLSFILEDLRSRRRLQALLQMDMIFNRNDFQKKLPEPDRETLRVIARMYWGILPSATRKDLKPYFSAQEISEMNLEMSLGPLPPPRIAEKATPPEPAPPLPRPAARSVPAPSASAPAEQNTTPASAPAPLSVLAAAAAPLAIAANIPASLPRPAAPALPAAAPIQTAPQVPATPAATAVDKPIPPVSQPAAATPQIPNTAAAMPSAAPTATTTVIPASATPAPAFPIIPAPAPLPPAQPAAPSPLPSAPAAPLPASPTPAQPPAPAPAPTAALERVPVYAPSASFSPEGFKVFLATAPYPREVKALLELLATHAREPERRTALGIVRDLLPSLLLDSSRSGRHGSSVLVEQGKDMLRPGNIQIALNDAPMILRWKKLFGKRTVRLPDDPGYYEALGLRPPALDAASRDKAPEREITEEEGTVAVYKDGSLRLRLSPEQLAGELLAALLEADARLKGWPSDIHLRLRSAAARNRFWRAYAKAQGRQPLLDPESLTAYQEWLERPEDWADLFFQTMERDPSVELRLLESAGLLSSEEASAALERLPKGKTVPQEGVKELPVSGPYARESWLETERLARESQ
ncbi:MAG: hypothetical protein WCU88_00045 [Elusimicrobiota bacterium]|jgi:hypothetical protein